MYTILKWFLFRLDPEKAHYATFSLMRIAFKIPGFSFFWKKYYQINNSKLKVNVAGIEFPNPVGLAAGFDKNALVINEFSACGFGFIEIGTVTPLPQEGNPKKRLFRLISDEAIVNRMGFNNDGMLIIAERLAKLRVGSKKQIIIGGNIGKNKNTPNLEAVSDYLKCFHSLEPFVDYFVVNVSSPNTPNLRELQDKEPLTALLQTLMSEKEKTHSTKPIFLKIAPDLTHSQLDDIIEIVSITKIDGVISSNTTIDRSNLKATSEIVDAIGMGGLSGKPLTDRSTEVIRYLHQNGKNSFPIIGVGGIHSAKDAIEKLDAGASLIQLYTGLIYEGPSLIKKINKAILART